ncbi:MAG: putative Zn-dependent peptidase [Phycisphaerales bacterium]|jgi:predicted Zn-dependent peptidase
MSVTYQEATLGNGLTIIAETSPEAQSAAAGFFVRTGARDEAAKIMGVSHYLEHMMFKGTESLTAEQINLGFDDMGARNNAYTTGEMTAFHAHVIPERLTEAVDLLAQMMRPALRQDDFDTEKQVILEEIAMYADNPFWVLYEETVDRHFAPHGLGHRVLGTKETVAAMQCDEMMDYFTQRYSADNTVVSLAGVLDFDETVKQIDALCGWWQTTGATRDESRPPVSNERFEMRDPKVNRGYLIAVSEAPAVGDDDRYAASALAFILGGSENSRLHWSLIETGLAEEAQSAYDGHAGTGDYFVYASGDPDKLDEIEGVINAQVAGLVESLHEDDLERLRNKLATGATLAGERPDGRMQRLGRQWANIGQYLSLEEELARIGQLTIADLQQVSEKYPFVPATVGRMLPAED